MKALWITSCYPWEGQPYGGVFFQTQARALASLGVELTIMVARPMVPAPLAWMSARHALQRSAPRLAMDGDLAVQRIPFLGHRFHRFYGWPHRGLAKRIRAELPFQPDLVHAHFAYPYGAAAVDLANRLGVPSIITLHGSDVNINATRSRLEGRRFRRAVLCASEVVAVSGALAEMTEALTGRRPYVMPIGVDLSRFRATLSKHEARIRLGLPIETPIILFVGNLLPAKGVLEVLEALEAPGLERVLGLFVGSGPLARQIKTRPRTLLQPSVQNDRIPEYMAAADLLVLPSYSEGLPTVLVEAGACGIPVVATPVGGIPELLTEDRGVLVPRGDVAALAEAVRGFLTNTSEAHRKAQRLKRFIDVNFNVQSNAKSLLEFYYSMCKIW